MISGRYKLLKVFEKGAGKNLFSKSFSPHKTKIKIKKYQKFSKTY
jgi:hypothetical protein